MARLVFPATDDRLVYRAQGSNLPFLSQAGVNVTIYTDAGGTILADIQTPVGGAIPGSVLTADANSQIPQFLGPDSVEVLYAKAGDGPVLPIFAWLQGRYNDFVADLAAAVAANDAQNLRLTHLEAAIPTGSVIDGGTA